MRRPQFFCALSCLVILLSLVSTYHCSSPFSGFAIMSKTRNAVPKFPLPSFFSTRYRLPTTRWSLLSSLGFLTPLEGGMMTRQSVTHSPPKAELEQQQKKVCMNYAYLLLDHYYRAANLWKLKSVIRMLKNRNFGQKSVISSMVFATSRKRHVIKRCIKKKKKKKKMMFAHTTLIKHKSH